MFDTVIVAFHNEQSVLDPKAVSLYFGRSTLYMLITADSEAMLEAGRDVLMGA